MRPLALVLALAALMTACTGEDDEARRAPVGALADGVVSVEGRTSVIALPGLELRATVGLPVQELSAAGVDLDTAPEGGSMVPISWTVDLAGAVRLPSLPDAEPPQVAVSLLADGRAYPLDEVLLRDRAEVEQGDPVLELSGSTAVAIAEEEPRDLAVRVEWDGVTIEAERGEEVRDAGVAERLATVPSRLVRTTVPCDPPRVRSPRGPLQVRQSACPVQVQRTPWVGGLGWAEPGRQWLVATGSTTLVGLTTTSRRDPVSYAVVETSPGPLTLDGEPAVREPAVEAGSTAFLAVFEVPEQDGVHTLERVDSVTTLGGFPEVGEDPTVVVRWSVDVPIV
ncbi:hypothetical protein GCM10023226_10310 [Nocardioides nanhaiensis]|uniref:Uncharacterized protein n=1 Tax=Nocardioides nanhaiensis TaxID=1476871 RepID=A0ABP8VY22_9ACTN